MCIPIKSCLRKYATQLNNDLAANGFTLASGKKADLYVG